MTYSVTTITFYVAQIVVCDQDHVLCGYGYIFFFFFLGGGEENQFIFLCDQDNVLCDQDNILSGFMWPR